MAKGNYTIEVDDRNVSEISRTEWKVIQQVGYGRSNKEIAQELNLRDRTQLAIWAVQTGVTTRNLEQM